MSTAEQCTLCKRGFGFIRVWLCSSRTEADSQSATTVQRRAPSVAGLGRVTKTNLTGMRSTLEYGHTSRTEITGSSQVSRSLVVRGF